MASIASTAFADFELIMAARGAKPASCISLSWCQSITAVFAYIMSVFAASLIPFGMGLLSPKFSLFRGAFSELISNSNAVFCFFCVVVAQWSATRPMVISVVIFQVAHTAKSNTITRLIFQFGIFQSWLNVASRKTEHFIAMLAMTVGPSKDSKFPSPLQLLIGWVGLKFNNIFHALSLTHMSPIKQGGY